MSAKTRGYSQVYAYGVKPILVLHYTSEFRKGQPALTKSNPNLTLRTRESEDLFDRLIKKYLDLVQKNYISKNTQLALSIIILQV